MYYVHIQKLIIKTRTYHDSSPNVDPGSVIDNVATLWTELLAWFKDHTVQDRFQSIKVSMFTNADDPHNVMPKLKGRAIEIRSLVPALCSVWERRMNPALPQHQAILEGLQSSAKMDEVLDSYPDVDVFPSHALRDFVDASWHYARCQNAVSEYYNTTEGYMIFDITIKTHWTLHCAMEAAYLNPRLSWNFAGEDFMMKCRELHQSCCKGNSPAQSVDKFADKYGYALQQIFVQFENGYRV